MGGTSKWLAILAVLELVLGLHAARGAGAVPAAREAQLFFSPG